MDYSVDKELDGWSQPEESGQWLYAQVQARLECISQRSDQEEMIFNIFFLMTNSEIECTLSKFVVDTKMSGITDRISWFSQFNPK